MLKKKIEHDFINDPYGKGTMFFLNDIIIVKNQQCLKNLNISSFKKISSKINSDIYNVEELLALYYFHYDSKINKILTPPIEVFNYKLNLAYNELEVLNSIVNKYDESSCILDFSKKTEEIFIKKESLYHFGSNKGREFTH